MSENHLQASIIDTFIAALFRFDEKYTGHCSNTIASESALEFSKKQPDYVIDVFNSSPVRCKFLNCFGEIKPEDADQEGVRT
jgi:hypothetical protein